MKIQVTRKKGIKGHIEQFIQPVYTFDKKGKLSEVRIINYKSKKDVTHKYDIKVVITKEIEIETQNF